MLKMEAPKTARGRLPDMAWLLVAAFAGLAGAGLLPRHDDWSPRANPAPDFETALARWRRLLAAERGQVEPANGSRLLAGSGPSKRVYLLVHGLTNSPRQWAAFGRMLHERGHTVLIPRLPYHALRGQEVAVLRALAPADLRAYADTAINMAAGLGDEVIVIGISGGATIAAWMAQNRPEVQRTLLLVPFFGLYGLPRSLNAWAANVLSRLPNVNLSHRDEPDRSWAYRGESSRGAAAFLLLGQALLNQARLGRRPNGEVRVITTAVDRVADNEATARLVAFWRRGGTLLHTYQFPPKRQIPHNAIDPSADVVKRQEVFVQMLDVLGEPPLGIAVDRRQ